jgi:pSer/pThr/pTyr-binding forkhead associated (FHA) protein
MRLHIVKDGLESAPRVVSGELRIGRAPQNDLVLSEPTVSARHAIVFTQGDRAFVRDLGSRNGTFVHEERVHTQAELHDGDTLRLGDAILAVRGSVEGRARYLVEEVGATVQHHVRDAHFLIGDGPHANLRIDGVEDVSLAIDDEGTIWLSTLSDGRELGCGELFEVGERQFRVVKAEGFDQVTETHLSDAVDGDGEAGESGAKRTPAERQYRLVVTLNGVSGPEARLQDQVSGNEYVVTAENRAVLLWVLAQKRLEALGTAGAEGDHDTWCADDDAAIGVWGRRGTSDANSLHVLVHRLRKELKKAGFDPWFIEKRRKAIRLALRDVTVA